MRDIEHIVNFFISMLFYVTPILYTPETFPEGLMWLLKLNPLTHLMISYRNIFFYHRNPGIDGLIIVFAFSVILFFAGYFFFEKIQKGFAEEV